jgi:hypothetical protein
MGFSDTNAVASSTLTGRLIVLISVWLALVVTAIAVLVAFERLPFHGLDFRHFWVAGQVWLEGG